MRKAFKTILLGASALLALCCSSAIDCQPEFSSLRVKSSMASDSAAVFFLDGRKQVYATIAKDGGFAIQLELSSGQVPQYVVVPSGATLESGLLQVGLAAEYSSSSAGVMVGKVEKDDSGMYADMKNACAMIGFSINRKDVTRVSISAKSATLSGEASFDISSGTPILQSVGKGSGLLLYASSGSLSKGDYLLPVLPFASSAILLEVQYSDGSVYKAESVTQMKAERSVITSLGVIGASSSFMEMPDADPLTPLPDPDPDPDEPRPIMELVLSFAGGNQPFTTKLPTTATVSSGDGDPYTLLQDGVEYEFVVFNTTGGYRHTGSCLRLNDSVGEPYDGAIRIPAVEGKYIKAIVLSHSNAGSKTVTMHKDRSSASIASVSIPGNGTGQLVPPEFKAGQSYWISGGQKNIQFNKIVVRYQ